MAPGEPGCVFDALLDSRMETEDSWLPQATRLSNPLVQKVKAKLFMELLCSINTQVENK